MIDLPKTGFVIFRSGQAYELIASEPYIRKSDGQISALMTWATNCPTCGNQFKVQTGKVFDNVNRRCPKCAKPGPIKTKS